MKISEDKVFFETDDGFKMVDENIALSYRLQDEGFLIFLLPVQNCANPNELTTGIFLNCNDVFGGGSDCEPINCNDGEEPSEIIDLYKMWKKDKKWGGIKWAAIKRNKKPWIRVKERMIEDGVWDEVMEKLND